LTIIVRLATSCLLPEAWRHRLGSLCGSIIGVGIGSAAVTAAPAAAAALPLRRARQRQAVQHAQRPRLEQPRLPLHIRRHHVAQHLRDQKMGLVCASALLDPSMMK
jgi:hypothetical protein